MLTQPPLYYYTVKSARRSHGPIRFTMTSYPADLIGPPLTARSSSNLTAQGKNKILWEVGSSLATNPFWETVKALEAV